MSRMLFRASLVTLAILALGAFAASCSDETEENVEEAVEGAREDVETGIENAQARLAAERFRGDLRAQETDDDTGGVRQIEALNQAAENLSGDTQANGIEDGDGDGADDDGFVEIVVGDESACVELPESGNEIDVSGGSCN